MNKTRRNDPCPCGSGKKYKKCCQYKSSNEIDDLSRMGFPEFYKEITKNIKLNEEVDATSFFKNYNNLDLLKTLSLIHVLPENHGKNIRLEEITRQAVLSNNGESVPIEITSLKKFIHQKFDFNHNEDPPENLFTENIMTPAGNMIIFPGLAEGQTYFLQQLINTISLSEVKLPENFITEALNSTMLLLSISDFIARSLKYERNMMVESDSNNAIFFPNLEFIENHKNYLALTKNELNSIASSLNTTADSIEDYIIDLSSISSTCEEPDLNPIIFNPIHKIDEEYIIVSPATIVFACVSSILNKAIKHDCFASLINSYSFSCWQHSRFVLQEMGYYEISFEFPKTELPIYESICIFDTNKLAYVLFKFDSGIDYDPTVPLQFYSNKQIDIQLQERRKCIYELITKDERFKKHFHFNLNLLCGIGRPTSTSFNPVSKNFLAIAISINDLVILYKSDKCDNLSLWNFSLALKETPLETPFFLDNFSFFIENDESLYSTDEKVDYLMISVGNALRFKSEAIKNYDEHACTYPTENGFDLVPVTREKLPAQLPIYSTRLVPFLNYKVTTPIQHKDFWIQPKRNFTKAEDELEKFDMEICIAVAFWISELSHELDNLIDLKKIKQIIVEIETLDYLITQETFDKLDKNKRLESEIKTVFTDNRMHISLNEHFYYSLFRNDNLGEKILIQKILESLNSMLVNKKLYTCLDDGTIIGLLDKYIPLGIKKKLLLQISDFDIRISPKNLKVLRELHPFEVNKQIDNLGKILTPAPYVVKKKLEEKEKLKLINNVVIHFYNGLRELINKYDLNDMLSKLLILYESAIQKRERFNLEASPKIECFKNHTDIISFVSKENKRNNQNSLSLRCLIEHIIAEPPIGSAILDVSGVDKAIAFMYNIVSWGFLSDELNFNIADTEVSLLPSGRIGTEKSFQTDAIEPFYNKKFNEDIIDLDEKFIGSFKLPEKKKVKSNSNEDFNLAFLSEFDFSHEIYSSVILESVFLAYEMDGSFYKCKIDEFYTVLSEKLKIESSTIQKVIETFSLYNRGKVEYESEFGFKNIDFYPWRYNRALSLLMKPFILTQEEQSDYIWFGVRALLDHKDHLLSSIFSGRYRAKSKELNTFLANLNHKKGKDFNNDVYDYCVKKLENAEVFKEITIKPSGILKNETDIGDLDVLIIDDIKRKILAIECKNINIARTPYEMHQELMNFISGNDPWIPKVDKRNIWMKRNIAALQTIHNKEDLDKYRFEYLILTNETIPLPFIKSNEIQYRFITFYDLKENLEIIY